MQIQPPQQIPFDPAQVTDVFTRMKAGENLMSILPDGLTIQYYYYIKSYKLIDTINFYAYCKQHKHDSIGNPTQFMAMLLDIVKLNYPPLEYCHTQADGYIGLDDYVNIAKTIF